jgi:ESS family glutamate:Na+ symporter
MGGTLNSPFPFDSMLVFSFLSCLLLVGIALRAKIGMIQKFLFPACLIGGVIGLVLLHAGIISMDASAIEIFAYHLFNISFISVGRTRNDEPVGPATGKRGIKGSIWMALMQGLTFPLQAVVGGLLVIVFGIAGLKLFPTFGFLVPLGFNEGPGQALSVGKTWEAVGFADAATIGLTFAAVGFFIAFFVGVPLVNYGIRKGWATFTPSQLPADFVTGILAKDGPKETAGHLTIHRGNADTLAFQAALVGLVYVVTYGLVALLDSMFSPDIAPILWGFFFFFGLGVALAVNRLISVAGIGHLSDPGIQRRITGWSVDYLIVATVAAIQLKIVWDYILPISLMAIANGVLTTLVVIWLGKKLDTFGLERSVAIFGTVTGTVSCGLLLLRIVDPEFKTPVAVEIAVMNIFVLPIIGGCTVLVNAPLWWGWSTSMTVLVFAGIFSSSLLALKCLGIMKRRDG